MDVKGDIIRKLLGIKAKAEATAGTPEGMIFLSKYNELMHKYNLTLTDLDVREAGINRIYKEAGNTKVKNKNIRHQMGFIVLKIAELTETVLVPVNWNSWGFVGTPVDLQYANWLYDLIYKTMERDATAYKMTRDYHERINNGQKSAEIVEAFKYGFRKAVNEALNQMIADNKIAGTGLILVKKELIESWLKEAGATAGSSIKSKALVIHQDIAGVVLKGKEQGEQVKLRKATESTVKGYLQ